MRSFCVVWILVVFPAFAGAQEPAGVEASYHGQLGRGEGVGMLEKWCALPNFSYPQQDGIVGWTSQGCNGCHIGATWNPTRPAADCSYCHTAAVPTAFDWPTPEKCLTCHVKDTAKRGDLFAPETDVHAATGFLCQDCHLKVSDETSDHQFLKGGAIDTTEPTLERTLACMICHSDSPHGQGQKAEELDRHAGFVACETCHTGRRPGSALESRSWSQFTAEGKPLTTMREPNWAPTHKWYDNTGPGASGGYLLPILHPAERRGAPGAKIYPFNTVTVTWYVKTPTSAFDNVIPVPEVKAADTDGDKIVTVDEMRTLYPSATLETADMTFSISHSVRPASQSFECNDCHGSQAWLIDWQALDLLYLFRDGFETGDTTSWALSVQ